MIFFDTRVQTKNTNFLHSLKIKSNLLNWTHTSQKAGLICIKQYIQPAVYSLSP